MFVRHSIKYNKGISIIHPGEFYVSDKDELIGTLLGSCVTVCLIDSGNGRVGMNHFMLPGRITQKDIFTDKEARYGIHAINELIKSMEACGSKKSGMVAKIFGGGHVLETVEDANSIPLDNIRVARVLMEIDDINIISSDVGGSYTRKLMLDVKSGLVYLKKTTRQDVFKEIENRDREYARRRFGNVQG
jgi:chemotaxis protein CheD